MVFQHSNLGIIIVKRERVLLEKLKAGWQVCAKEED